MTAIPNHTINYFAPLAPGAPCSVGQVMIPNADDGSYYVVATTANRGGRGSEGVAITAWGGAAGTVGVVKLQQDGILPAEMSGLSSGYGSRVFVRCSATGTIERITSYTPGDDVIGLAEADGRVHLFFGMPVAAMLAAAAAAATDATTASNVGTGEGQVYKEEVGDDLRFRTIKAGSNITVTNNTNDVTITSTSSAGPTITNSTNSGLADIASDSGGTPADVIRLTGSDVILRSILGGTESRKLVVSFLGSASANHIIANEYTTGTTASARILTGTGGNVYVRANEQVLLVYDITSSRWRLQRGVGGEEVLYTALTSDGFNGILGAHNVLINGGVGSSGAAAQGSIKLGPQSDNATGSIRLGPSDTIVWAKSDLTTTMANVYQDGANRCRIGDYTNLNYLAFGGDTIGNDNLMVSYMNVRAQIGSALAHRFQLAGLLAGSQLDSRPFRLGYQAFSLDGTINSTTTVPAAYYENPILDVATGNTGQSIVLPNHNGAVFIVKETGNNALIAKVSGQTGVTIGALKRAIIRCNGTDYERVTADA